MRSLLLASTLMIGLVALPAIAQDKNLAAKMELAQEYSKLVPVEAEVETSIEQLALQVPVAQRVLFKSILKENIKADRLKLVSEMALVELFTVKELKAMNEFYGTPEGKAIKDKMPEYQERLQPILQGMIQDSIQSLERQMK